MILERVSKILNKNRGKHYEGNLTLLKDSSLNFWITYLSYRLKPKPYGVNALFGIDLAPTDTENKIAGVIRVGDTVEIIRDDPDFWQQTE